MNLNEMLDLRGIPCPQNTAKALLKLELIDDGEYLDILIDDGEPITNFLEALDFEEIYKVESKNQKESSHWELKVRKCEE